MKKMQRNGMEYASSAWTTEARKQTRRKYFQTVRSTINTLIVFSAIAVLLATLFFPVFRIYGMSMAPTINGGEIVVARKGSKFQCGDVIVLSYNNRILVKRVIAGPGQWVDMDLEGNVSVDGKRIEEPYLQETAYGDCTQKLPYQVPDGKYFVMGDNRATSQDSRNATVGCIPEEQIIGKTVMRVWPIQRVSIWL
ncbi:MAG: signal peptidase I [Clostridiales bacterium]|nr:signal peptidase I [Candidatus Cacconaster stercorequi]